MNAATKMTHDQAAKWILEALRSIAKHQENIAALFDKGQYNEAKTIQGYRDNLSRRIVELRSIYPGI